MVLFGNRTVQIEAHVPEIPVALLADKVVTTERSHDLKFDKRVIYEPLHVISKNVAF